MKDKVQRPSRFTKAFRALLYSDTEPLRMIVIKR